MFFRRQFKISNPGPAPVPAAGHAPATVPTRRLPSLFFLSASLCGAALLYGCLSGSDGKSRNGSGVSVSLQFRTEPLAKASAAASALAARPVDSAHVRVSAPGMDTLRFGFGGVGGAISILDIPPGADRRFDVRLYSQGVLLYAGAATAELKAGQANNVSVSCLPEFSRLTASIHIPADFPKSVAGGELRLWNAGGTLTASPTVSGELRNFRLEEVPGDRDYAVSIALWDAMGDTVAKGFKADLHVPKGQNVALVLPLTLAFTQLALTMTVAEPHATTLVLTLPGGRRAPAAFGEAVFSELYAIPTTDEGGDNGEWLELFNRARDTLDVSGCQVLRDAGTGSGMNLALPAGTLIAPGRGLVVGRSAVAFAHVTQATALTLTNTSARLEFACASGAVRVDTLRYATSASDTLSARIVSAKVSSLKPSRLANRHRSDAWCLAATNPGATEFAATPGGIAGGCGE